MPESLPPFEFSARVSASQALLDKIELIVGTWDFEGHPESIDVLREHLSVPPRNLQIGDDTAEVWSGYRLLFNRPGSSGNWLMPMAFRSTPITVRGCHRRNPCLWSGRLEFRSVPPVRGGPNDVSIFDLPIRHRMAPPVSAEAGGAIPTLDGTEQQTAPLLGGRGNNVRFRTQFDVSINPTRFARHQPLRLHPSTGQLLVGPACHYASRVRRGADRVPLQFAGEFSLDGNDNWLPQGPRLSLGDSQRWPTVLIRSFLGFIYEFNQQVETLCEWHDIQEIRCTPEQHVNLKTCETYWEFSSPDPVALVAGLANSLGEFGRGELTTRSFLVRDHETGVVSHARLVIVDAGPGRSIKVYAKTNQRVRFEVKHRMVGDNPHRLRRTGEAVPRQSGRGGDHFPTGHTSSEWEGLYDMLHSLAHDAAALINRLFAFLERRQNIIPSPLTAQLLIQRVLSVVPDSNAAWELLRCLGREGRILAASLPSSFDAPIQALMQNQILERHDGLVTDRCFTVVSQYRPALQALHALMEPVMPPCRVRVPPSGQQRMQQLPDDPTRPRVRRPPNDPTQPRVRRPPSQS